jgi:hypothetical protein
MTDQRTRTPRIVARVSLSIDAPHKGRFADFAVRGQTGEMRHRSWMLAERAFQIAHNSKIASCTEGKIVL